MASPAIASAATDWLFVGGTIVLLAAVFVAIIAGVAFVFAGV